jgi:hypothetical protein
MGGRVSLIMSTPGAKQRVQNRVIAASVPTSTWNPADKGASVVLSGGNLIAAKAAAGYQSVRGTISKSSGNRYFEITAVNTSGGAIPLIVGVADAGFALTVRYLGEANAGAKKSAGRYGAGTFFRNMTNAATNAAVAAYANGAVIGVGVNFSTFVISLYNGLTGALITSYTDATPWPALFPAATMQNGASCSLNTAGPFAFLPAGRVTWDSP